MTPQGLPRGHLLPLVFEDQSSPQDSERRRDSRVQPVVSRVKGNLGHEGHMVLSVSPYVVKLKKIPGWE